MNGKEVRERYLKKHGDLIPLMEVMGNEILQKEFFGVPELVYDYCLLTNKTWQEVLKFKYQDDVLY